MYDAGSTERSRNFSDFPVGSSGPLFGNRESSRSHHPIGGYHSLTVSDERPPPPLPPSDEIIVGIEVRLLRLPMLEALEAAHGPAARAVRELAVVAVRGSGGEIGWGECAALESSGYWHETASSSFDTLSRVAAVFGRRPAGDLVAPDGIVGIDRVRFPMAGAALEMAALDLTLKTDGRSLAEWLEVDAPVAPAGATVGLGSASFVADRVDDLVSEGYGRIKVKVEPSSVSSVIAAITERHSDPTAAGFELHIDGNGGFASIDPSPNREHRGPLAVLVDTAGLGVTVIEQPFDRHDTVSGRLLRAALAEAGRPTLVMADESVDSITSADEGGSLRLGRRCGGQAVSAGWARSGPPGHRPGGWRWASGRHRRHGGVGPGAPQPGALGRHVGRDRDRRSVAGSAVAGRRPVARPGNEARE